MGSSHIVEFENCDMNGVKLLDGKELEQCMGEFGSCFWFF
jgi:hypothetical protein